MTIFLAYRMAISLMFTASLVANATAQERPKADRSATFEGLSAKDVEVRRGAATALRISDREAQSKALPLLIELLAKEKDGQVRLAVLDTIIALGPGASEAVPALVQTLRSDYGGQGQEESHQDYRAAFALGAIGKPAVEGLRGLLKEQKERVRAEAAMGLGRIGSDAGAAVVDLVSLLSDKSERVRREASESLGRIGPPAIPSLITASTQVDPIVRARAVEALGGVSAPDDRVRLAMLERVKDPTPEVRAAALRFLARLKLPEETLRPIAQENLRREDEGIRRAVVDMLVEERVLLPQMTSDLEQLLDAANEGVSHDAAFLLRKIGVDAVPLLLNALRREKCRIDQIAEALAQIGRPAVGPLLEAVDGPEARVRRGSALALGQIRPIAPGTLKKLTNGLSSLDPEVRSAFLTAIGSLGSRTGEAVPAVRAALKDDSGDNRIKAIDVLSHVAPRDEQMLDDLIGLLDDPDPRVQRQAIDTIRSLGPIGRKALNIAIGKLSSENPDVRFSAAQLVESHGQGATEAVPALSSLLGDPNPKMRTMAALILGKLGRPAQSAFPMLIRLLDADSVEVREAAVSTIAGLELEPEIIRPFLAKALGDEKTEVRRAATRGIQRLGPQGAIFIPDIIAMASKKENARSVERLLRTFEGSGPEAKSLPELIKLIDHDQLAVRLLAIKFLGLAGPRARQAMLALERIKEDPSEEVRKQVKVACEKISGEGETTQPRP